jgi:hypothetical protein
MAGQAYAKTLTSFSGSDLVVNFGPKTIGELQQISWGIKREKAPVFTLGSADPRSFSRGKRGIGGSLVFAQFNRDALMSELVDDVNTFKNIAPIAMFTAAGNLSLRGAEKFKDALSLTDWNNRNLNDNGVDPSQIPAVPVAFGTTDASGEIKLGTAKGNDGTSTVTVPAGFGIIRAENIMYADMIPPFDVTLTFANEYGNAAFQKMYDLDIMDESSGVNVDSIVMERQMSYVARRISPLMEGVYYRSSSGIITANKDYIK